VSDAGTIADWAAVAAAMAAGSAAFLQWRATNYQARIAQFDLRVRALKQVERAATLAMARSTRDDAALAEFVAATNNIHLLFPRDLDPLFKAIGRTIACLISAEEDHDPENSNAGARIALRQQLMEELSRLREATEPFVRLDRK
jgi:hypothetical protein